MVMDPMVGHALLCTVKLFEKTTVWRKKLFQKKVFENTLFDCCTCGELPLSGADLSVGEFWPSRMA